MATEATAFALRCRKLGGGVGFFEARDYEREIRYYVQHVQVQRDAVPQADADESKRNVQRASWLAIRR